MGWRNSISEICPGGPYSGCPGSMSRRKTECCSDFMASRSMVKRRLSNNLPKVDLPVDFGPQTMIFSYKPGFRFDAAEQILSIALCHSGGISR